MEKIIAKKLDPNFKHEIASKPGAQNIKKCYSCGTCTAACPVFRVEAAYNPRKIIRMILLGMRHEVLSSKMIWLCARCYACTANCPQEVNFADIMTVLRDLAVKEGYGTPELLSQIEEVTVAASRFRKDCINSITGAGDVKKENIKANVEETIGKLK